MRIFVRFTTFKIAILFTPNQSYNSMAKIMHLIRNHKRAFIITISVTIFTDFSAIIFDATRKNLSMNLVMLVFV